MENSNLDVKSQGDAGHLGKFSVSANDPQKSDSPNEARTAHKQGSENSDDTVFEGSHSEVFAAPGRLWKSSNELQTTETIMKGKLGDQVPGIIMKHEEFYIGPLPSPETLGDYERVLPGLAHRITEMTKREQQSRIARLQQELTSTTNTIRWGQLFAFILGLVRMGISYALIMANHDAGGTLFGAVSLAALIGPFLKNWWSA